jgi:pimeloyl-ACP methyl ester carboxylesterase
MTRPTRLAVTEHLPDGDSGSGPLVVFVHGSLDRSTSFTRVLRRLDDLHTVAYDRRGYHRSRRTGPVHTTLDGHIDDLLEVIDDRPAAVVGHSYGGAIALGAALRPGPANPIRSVAAYEPPMPWLGLWPTRTPSPAANGDEDTGAVAERFFRRQVGDAAWERLPDQGKQARRDDGAALAAELAAIRLTEAPFDVTALTVPATFARGEHSPDRHRAAVAWLVEHTPDAELVEFPGANHGAHLTHPDAFAALARRTLARAGLPAGTAR